MERFFEWSNLALSGPYPRPQTIAAIPAYNEAKYIADIIKNTKKYVDQVIVIDDGSIDGTHKIAEETGAAVVRHKVNMGKGTAINTAFKITREIRSFAMVLLDGDGQHDPEAIPALLEPIYQKKADIVVGSRFMTNNHIPKYRILGQSVLNFTTNLGSGIKLTDTQSGFRAFSRKAIESLSFCERGFSVESEMQFRAKEFGLKVMEVPIVTNYNGETKRSPVTHGFGVLFRVIKLTWDKYLTSFPAQGNGARPNNRKAADIPSKNILLLKDNIQITEAKNQ